MSVYTMGGPHSGSEKNIDERLAKLNPKINKITDNITKALTNALTAPKRSNAYWLAVQRELDLYYSQLYAVYDDWMKVNIVGVQKDSLFAVEKQITQMANVAAKASKSVTQIMASQAAQQLSTSLYTDAMASWVGSLSAGKSNMYRLTRMTQQGLIDEWVIDKSVAKAIESGNLRNFSSILAQNNPQYQKLLEAAMNERYLQAGGRKFTPEYYAEMVSRVKFHEAQSQASLMQAANYDTDLMVVSSHNTKTKICLEFEGKIFSISGKDKRFPPLTQMSPFHVNCLHLMFPQFESALEASGTLDGFSDFSKNKIDKPPAPASFIPASEREVV